MRWLLFLSRLAFICGIFFLLALSLRITDWTHDETISSTIIILGYSIGAVIVPATITCYVVVLIIKKKLRAYVPLWLIMANVLFLAVLFYYIFYLDDPYYHQG